jgi:hypothetical protein
VLQRRFHALEIFRESDHGFLRIPFGESREEVGVAGAEMPLDPIIHPGQAKNLNRPRAGGAVRVTVKPPVEKYISRYDLKATPKTGFYKGAGQYDARITLPMAVAGGCAAPRKCLEPNLT